MFICYGFVLKTAILRRFEALWRIFNHLIFLIHKFGIPIAYILITNKWLFLCIPQQLQRVNHKNVMILMIV